MLAVIAIAAVLIALSSKANAADSTPGKAYQIDFPGSGADREISSGGGIVRRYPDGNPNEVPGAGPMMPTTPGPVAGVPPVTNAPTNTQLPASVPYRPAPVPIPARIPVASAPATSTPATRVSPVDRPISPARAGTPKQSAR
jgi:hypothetical protein